MMTAKNQTADYKHRVERRRIVCIIGRQEEEGAEIFSLHLYHQPVKPNCSNTNALIVLETKNERVRK